MCRIEPVAELLGGGERRDAVMGTAGDTGPSSVQFMLCSAASTFHEEPMVPAGFTHHGAPLPEFSLF